jgi:hypothetical protein
MRVYLSNSASILFQPMIFCLSLIQWFVSLGEPYGVNTFIFGGLYIGTVPFFWMSVFWLVKNTRRSKQTCIPMALASLCWFSPYIYIFIAGNGLPVWIWAAMGVAALFTLRSLRKSMNAPAAEPVSIRQSAHFTPTILFPVRRKRAA